MKLVHSCKNSDRDLGYKSKKFDNKRSSFFSQNSNSIVSKVWIRQHFFKSLLFLLFISISNDLILNIKFCVNNCIITNPK